MHYNRKSYHNNQTKTGTSLFITNRHIETKVENDWNIFYNYLILSQKQNFSIHLIHKNRYAYDLERPFPSINNMHNKLSAYRYKNHIHKKWFYGIELYSKANFTDMSWLISKYSHLFRNIKENKAFQTRYKQIKEIRTKFKYVLSKINYIKETEYG